MKKNINKTLSDWCVENDRMDVLELWDYTLNKDSPNEVAYGSTKKFWFKCSKGIHKSEEKILNNLTSNYRKITCNQCNSFGQWLIDTFGEDALEKYWDYRKNKVNPFEIERYSQNKVWIFCQEVDYHESYEIRCDSFIGGSRCPYCAGNRRVHPKDSFGQMLVDEYGSLEIIWDFEKNGDLNPFSLTKNSAKKVWLFCLKTDYHGSYETKCYEFTRGRGCCYCNRKKKVHPKDSFAQYHIDNTDQNFIEKYWSKKNIIDPFTLAPCANKKVWIICQNDEEHEDYQVTCNNFFHGQRCGECKESKGEREIRKILNTHNINFIPQKEFSDLVGTSEWKPLSYDFYLPEHNLLIEYQGNYHDGTAKQQTEEDYLRQQEHDRRKKEYAKLHNIKLLEIWYWDFDNIETILNENVK